MLRKTLLVAGALGALAAPALFATAATAAQSAKWYVIEDLGNATCNVVDRQPASGETELGGPFLTIDLAQAAMAGYPACERGVQSMYE